MSKGHREARVVFGFHAVLARLRADPSSVLEIFLDEARNDARAKDLVAAAERANVKLARVAVKRLDGFYGGGRHQGVVARVEVKRVADSLDELLDALQEPPLLLVLDGVTDPHNLGACLRVANAAGAHAVIAPKDRAAGINPTVSKVASGAAELTPYLMVTNLARTLDEYFVDGLVHITELGRDYFQFDAARHMLLGERTGKRYRLADRMKVKLVRVDLETRKIDFVPAP